MKYFYISFLLLFCVTTYSQTGKITYNSIFNFNNGLNKNSTALYFTRQASLNTRDIENFKKKENTVKSEQIGKEKTTEIYLSADNDSIGNQTYYNLKERTLTCRASLLDGLKLKFYIYEDKGAGKISWKLQDEFKTISGYTCQKAIGEFRGRTYEAWFTTEIPLPYGPWKLVGLPGLILEVYDLNKEVYYEVENIKIPFEEANTWVKKPSDDPTMTHKEYITAKRDVTNKIVKALKARMPKDHKMTSVKTIKNDIELEYEWEKE